MVLCDPCVIPTGCSKKSIRVFFRRSVFVLSRDEGRLQFSGAFMSQICHVMLVPGLLASLAFINSVIPNSTKVIEGGQRVCHMSVTFVRVGHMKL